MPPRIACLAAAIFLASCDQAPSTGPSASVTMKLPPARPADARPGFSKLIDEVPEAADPAAG